MRLSHRAVMRIVMAVFMLFGFVLHFRATDKLVAITPSWVPFPRDIVLATGILELILAATLLIPRLRKISGILIALYVLAVWPANIKHAFEHIVLPPIPDTWWYHAPRLAFQPVIAWWALYAARVIDWPFGRDGTPSSEPDSRAMTGNSELDHWQERYATPDYRFGKAPNEFLARCKPLLPRTGKALAVADGEGRNGVWLAKQGLDVLSTDFSPAAQAKGRALAAENKVDVTFVEADAHAWPYPQDAFNVVAEIFTQFSTPAQREQKWAGMRRALKRGGLLIVQGYTPKQLDYGTGGPKQIEHLYTRQMLEIAFGDLNDVTILEEERELQEGAGHSGMSAVIGLTARKP